MRIEFSDDAAGSFADALNRYGRATLMSGYSVRITFQDGRVVEGELLGSDPDSEWRDAAAVQPFDFDKGVPVGRVESGRVEAVFIF